MRATSRPTCRNPFQSPHLTLIQTRQLAASAIVVLAGACRGPSSDVAPARTSHEITAADTRSRIYLVADDSMLGRQSGTRGNFMMTEYLAREVARLGLEPGGENGTFFQTVPMVRRSVDAVVTTMSVAGRKLGIFTEFAPLRPNMTERYAQSLAAGQFETIYGGRAGDSTGTLSAEAVRGKIVVLDAPLDESGKPTGVWATPANISRASYPAAAGIAIAALDLVTPASLAGLRGTGNAVSEPGRRAPAAFLITSAVAEEIMGAGLGVLNRGTAGKRVSAAIRFNDQPVAHPARNVIAIVRGADPRLRDEYVAIGAHSDHTGIAPVPVDHDSLRSYYRVMRPEGAQRRGVQPGPPTPAQWARIRASLDSLRRLRPPRLDSINNGADDDGSGSVALLEIAEYLASAPRPRRSILLVWHTAEEGGLLGSGWFTEYPTVPRSAIIAQLNMDMVGRGSATDIAGGGPAYLQVIGSRRLSTDLGDVIDSVNANRSHTYRIDYSWDAPGHPMARFCRSDHYNYAKRGIPIAFFSRGYHSEYHVVTDEPQYINYEGLANVSRFIRDIGVALANRDRRPRVDKPVQNPLLPCRQ